MPVVEVASFAHPKVVPNMKDAEEVFARIRRKPGVVGDLVEWDEGIGSGKLAFVGCVDVDHERSLDLAALIELRWREADEGRRHRRHVHFSGTILGGGRVVHSWHAEQEVADGQRRDQH